MKDLFAAGFPQSSDLELRILILGTDTCISYDHQTTVYGFASSRAGEHARIFLDHWLGKLVCDDHAGYKAGFGKGITEIGSMDELLPHNWIPATTNKV